jgi:VanZ family protein
MVTRLAIAVGVALVASALPARWWARRSYRSRRRRGVAHPVAWRQSNGDALAVMAVAAVLAATLVPSPYVGRHYAHGRQLRAVASEPREAMSFNVIGNVALFLPLGAALGFRRRSFPLALTAGTALSTTVEALQYALYLGRSTEPSDVVFNVAGTALGFAAGRAAWRADDDRPADEVG